MNLDIKFPPTVSAYMQSDARYRFIVGPFGSGKSVGSQVEIPRRAAMQRPSTLNGRRKTRFAVIRNTMPQLRDTTLKTWLDWFPNGSLGAWQSTTKTYHIRHGDIESEVVFRALDDAADVKNLLSLELTGAYINEFRDIPREIVEALDGRIGRYPRMNEGGPSWIGMWGDSNMPLELSYWNAMMEGLNPDDLKTRKPNAWQIFRQPPAMLKIGEDQYVPNADAENLENLPPGYYEALIDGKTTDFIRVNVLVQYGRQKGGRPVHPEFRRDLHVAKGPITPNRELVLIIGADFGLTPAMALKQQDAFGRVITLDEIVTFDMGLERACEEKLIPLLRKKYSGFEVVATGDPSGDNRAQSDESTCADILRYYKKRYFKDGRTPLITKVKLCPTNAPAARRGATDKFLVNKEHPAYLIDPSCEMSIQALDGRFSYKVTKDGRHSEEVDKNDWSHIGEANEYGDFWFSNGGRRKAEIQQPDGFIEALRRQQHGNPYALPRG